MLRIRNLAIRVIGLAGLAVALAGLALAFGSLRVSTGGAALAEPDSREVALAQLTPTPEARRRPPPPVPGALFNATFSEQVEGAPLGWTAFGPPARVETTGAGLSGVRVTVGSVGISWLGQTVSIRGGSGFELRARAGGDARPVLRVSWHAAADGSGAPLGFVESRPAESSGGSTLLVAGPFGTPGNARSIRVRLVAEGSIGTSALFSSLSLTAATAPPPTGAPVANAPTPASQAIAPTAPAPGPLSGTEAPAATPRPPTPSSSGPTTAPAPAGSAALGGAKSGGAPTQPPLPTQRPEAPGPAAALKINEVGFGMTDDLWVELYNASGAVALLEGCTLVNGADTIELPALTLPGHAYLVIATGAGFSDDFPRFDAAIVFVGARPGGARRGGGSLMLLGPEGLASDAVSWGSDASIFAPPPAAVSPGGSIERRPAGLDRDLPEDFVENAHPTPGYGLDRVIVVDGGGDGLEVTLWAAVVAVSSTLAAAAAFLGWRLRRRPDVPPAAGEPVGVSEPAVIDAGPPPVGSRSPSLRSIAMAALIAVPILLGFGRLLRSRGRLWRGGRRRRDRRVR